MILIPTLEAFCALLEDQGIRYVIGGSLSSSLWGEARTTNDADIAISISEPQLKTLVDALTWPWVVGRETLMEGLLSGQEFASGQVMHGETLDQIALFLLPSDPYSESQLSRVFRVGVGDGPKLAYASAEDVVITKLRWFDLGNRVSDKQWNDIVQVLVEHQLGRLDMDYLRHWTSHFGHLELLEEALSQVVV